MGWGRVSVGVWVGGRTGGEGYGFVVWWWVGPGGGDRPPPLTKVLMEAQMRPALLTPAERNPWIKA